MRSTRLAFKKCSWELGQLIGLATQLTANIDNMIAEKANRFFLAVRLH
jgi:hypothetical protein